MDGGGGGAEADEHSPPLHGGGLRGEGRVGGVPLAYFVEGVLRPKRLGFKLTVSLLLFEEQRRVGIDYAYYIL
jgi:hypothetical protein